MRSTVETRSSVPDSEVSSDRKRDEKSKRKQRKPQERWTAEETNKLVEAFNLHGNDWLKVCEHVGTKTKSQCYLKVFNLKLKRVAAAGEVPPKDAPLSEQISSSAEVN